MEVDRNGFVVGPSVASSLPEWQLSQMKQEQRLQKWRSMLGKLYLFHYGAVHVLKLRADGPSQPRFAQCKASVEFCRHRDI